MRTITEKITTLREAEAKATIFTTAEVIERIRKNDLPKPDIFPTARAAALLAVKNTPYVIPHCHPIPIDGCDINFHLTESSIEIEVIVKSINKTGCEMEALHGAAVAALTVYDLLKPLQAWMEISKVMLTRKKGGKTDFAGYEKIGAALKSAVVVISDSVSKGTKKDSSGLVIREKLTGSHVPVVQYLVIPDEKEEIQQTVQRLVEEKIDLIVTTGGTGLSPRDVTPEAIKPLLDCEIPGIMEAARAYGQERTPYSMLSRGIAGKIKDTLILCLPGSSKGVRESMDALFPYVLHVFRVAEGWDHHTQEYKKKKRSS